MADNLEENSLNNSTSNPSDSAYHKTVSSIETNAYHQNQDTENMEIHQHAHHEHGKRNWKSYFWEFSMLFLAVICAYLAESYHTHSVNKDIEKRNIEMVVHNLNKDIEQLNRIIKANERKVSILDSIASFQGLESIDTLFTPKFADLLGRGLPMYNFDSYSAAVDQMKSSGSLRLIKNKDVLEVIYDYDRANNVIDVNSNALYDFGRRIIEPLSSFYFTDTTVTPRLLVKQIERLKSKDETINNRQEIYNFYNHIRSNKRMLVSIYIPQLHSQKARAHTLKQLLEKEYNLKK